MSCTNGAGCGPNEYGNIASGFSLVPDNYNSVTNFIPLRPVYRSLQVVENAIANVGPRCGDSCKSGCCDTGRDVPYSPERIGELNMGYTGLLQYARPNEVTVCNKASCVCSKGANTDSANYVSAGCCKGASCLELENFGYCEYPRPAYFMDLKACNAITTEACKKHGKKSCKSCHVVASCKKGCKKSCQSVSTVAPAPAARTMPGKRGGCGCR